MQYLIASGGRLCSDERIRVGRNSEAYCAENPAIDALPSADYASLIVKFQEVVHSVPAEEAEVAETSVIPRRTEWTRTRMLA